MSDSRGELEARLAAKLERMRSMSAYEIFELWPGCGRAEVNKRYPEMVKRNHPDRYGGNISADIKRLSHDIFLIVQRARKELVRAEKEQTVTRDAASHGAASGAAPSIPIADAAQSVSRVFEAETRSTRSQTSWSETDALPTEERRERLARLARTARPRRPSRPLVVSEPLGLEEDSALSQHERRERLARLAHRAASASPRAGASHQRITRASGAHSAVSRASSDDAMQTGLAALHRGDFALALEHFDAARVDRPDDVLLEMLSAYTSFRVDPSLASEAEKRLRAVLEAKDRQATPDAHLYLGYILDSYDSEQKKREAYRHFKQALALNPSSRGAERMVRLYRTRHNAGPALADEASSVPSFFKKMFKKK